MPSRCSSAELQPNPTGGPRGGPGLCWTAVLAVSRSPRTRWELSQAYRRSPWAEWGPLQGWQVLFAGPRPSRQAHGVTDSLPPSPCSCLALSTCPAALPEPAWDTRRGGEGVMPFLGSAELSHGGLARCPQLIPEAGPWGLCMQNVGFSSAAHRSRMVLALGAACRVLTHRPG